MNPNADNRKKFTDSDFTDNNIPDELFMSKENKFFSQWISDKLPRKLGDGLYFNVSDIDFILLNPVSKKFALIEIKQIVWTLKKTQIEIYQLIHNRLKDAQKYSFDGWKYAGVYYVQFDYKDKFWLNKEPITEDELIKVLSLF